MSDTDGPMTEENHPEPISERELQMALLLVGGRFPNCKFVIEKYIEQLRATTMPPPTRSAEDE